MFLACWVVICGWHPQVYLPQFSEEQDASAGYKSLIPSLLVRGCQSAMTCFSRGRVSSLLRV